MSFLFFLCQFFLFELDLAFVVYFLCFSPKPSSLLFLRSISYVLFNNLSPFSFSLFLLPFTSARFSDVTLNSVVLYDPSG